MLEAGENPLILERKLTCRGEPHLVYRKVHEHEARCVPQLVCKVSRSLDLFVREAHIVSGRVACRERKAEGIRAVLLDDLERVDTVAERL